MASKPKNKKIDTWTLAQAAIWFDTRDEAKSARAAPAMCPTDTAVAALYAAMKSGSLTPEGLVDGTHRSDITPAEWRSYRLIVIRKKLTNLLRAGSAGNYFVEGRSKRPLPAAIVAMKIERAPVAPFDAAGQPYVAYYRPIQDISVDRAQVIALWPARKASVNGTPVKRQRSQADIAEDVKRLTIAFFEYFKRHHIGRIKNETGHPISNRELRASIKRKDGQGVHDRTLETARKAALRDLLRESVISGNNTWLKDQRGRKPHA